MSVDQGDYSNGGKGLSIWLPPPARLNFDGYLRRGVSGPRQVQLAVKFKF